MRHLSGDAQCFQLFAIQGKLHRSGIADAQPEADFGLPGSVASRKINGIAGVLVIDDHLDPGGVRDGGM